MYWTKFKHIKLLFFFIGTFFISACSNEIEETKDPLENEIKETLSEEEQIILQVESILSINAEENYDIQIEYKYINEDTLRDVLVLVNRKEFAFQKAKSTNTERFFQNTGHTGLYNYVFVKMGGQKNLISTNPVGSNAEYPLKSTFLELTSKAHQDFYVEYRVKNSFYRNYYTVRGNRLFLTFSCQVFDNIGEINPKVYDIQHLTSPVRIAKDIALYEGKIVDYNPSEIEDVNNYEPKEIVKSGELYVFFIFNDKLMKYVTPMRAEEE